MGLRIENNDLFWFKKYFATSFFQNELLGDFLGKTQNRWFLLYIKSNWVGLYFSGAFYIWDVWDMAEKNTQSLCPKFRFSPLAP